jgi:hypothetical protein
MSKSFQCAGAANAMTIRLVEVVVMRYVTLGFGGAANASAVSPNLSSHRLPVCLNSLISYPFRRKLVYVTSEANA